MTTILAINVSREATVARDLAKSRELASSASNEVNVDPEPAILLGLRALDYAVTREAEAAVHAALAASRMRVILKHDDQFVSDVAFSPDGARLATASGTGAHVWDIVTGKPVLALAGHQGDVRAISYSPDGVRIATGVGTERSVCLMQ